MAGPTSEIRTVASIAKRKTQVRSFALQAITRNLSRNISRNHTQSPTQSPRDIPENQDAAGGACVVLTFRSSRR